MVHVARTVPRLTQNQAGSIFGGVFINSEVSFDGLVECAPHACNPKLTPDSCSRSRHYSLEQFAFIVNTLCKSQSLSRTGVRTHTSIPKSGQDHAPCKDNIRGIRKICFANALHAIKFHALRQYHDLLRSCFENVVTAPIAQAHRTLSVCSVHRHDSIARRRAGSRLLATKKLHIKSIVYELFVLRGDTNIRYLERAWRPRSGMNGLTKKWRARPRSMVRNGGIGRGADGSARGSNR